jgi:nucleotide-binding universal stress UspA family protein
MMKTKTILIPLDGSEMAEAALADARQLSGPESTLVLVRAASALALPGTEMMDAQIYAVQEAEAYLDDLKTKLEAEGVRGVDVHVWYGPAAAAIVDGARLYGADLIVMSTHGRSGFGRVVFGSVAESVLRGTTVPILLVRPSDAPIATMPGREHAAPAASPRREVVR